jgi:hypothetical protein
MKAVKICACVLALFPLWPIMAIRLVGWGITGACDFLLSRATWYRGIGDYLSDLCPTEAEEEYESLQEH